MVLITKSPSGSPARSAYSNLTSSVTAVESTDDDDSSNFLALLQTDAFKLLGLRGQTTPNPAEVRAAYKTCKEQTLTSLERCEDVASGSFLISQRNYLELKLNALDQALEELLPSEDKEPNVGGDATNQEQQKQQPSQSALSRDVEGDDDDDLDTIDVYFNGPKQSDEPKITDQSDAASILSWDTSSIFSMISNTKTTTTDCASESGLSEAPTKKDKDKNDVSGSSRVPTTKSSLLRPPLGINRAITSPTSIMEFRNKEVGHSMRRRRITARRRLMVVDPTDAIRQGVMRALDEDDSECVSLDFEDGYPKMSTRGKAPDRESIKEIQIVGPRSRGRGVISDEDQVSTFSTIDNGDDDEDNVDDVASSTCDNTCRTKMTQPLEEDFYESLVQSGMDSYNSILESSIDMSSQFCEVLQTCWVDEGSPLDGDKTYTQFSTIKERSVPDDLTGDKSCEQTIEERSVADDLTGVYTDGESTAFNTQTSFGKD